MRWLASGMQYLLSTDEANSRFVYLLQGAAAAAGVLILVIAFISTPHDQRDGYEIMTATLLGGGSLCHVGRMLTKNAGQPAEPKDPKGSQ